MVLSTLKLNPDKIDIFVCGSEAQRQKLCSHFPVNIFGNLLYPADLVPPLGKSSKRHVCQSLSIIAYRLPVYFLLV